MQPGAAGWEEREMNGLLINDNTLENSHYYMGDVVLHALNSQTPYSSNFGQWSLGLGAVTHRARRAFPEWTGNVIHKKCESRVEMDYI